MNLCDAVAGKHLVAFVYADHQRVVIPAAHGTHKTTGNTVLRAYQIRGTSSTRDIPLWDLFLVDKMQDVQILDETFADDPPQYSRGDKHINICCEL